MTTRTQWIAAICLFVGAAGVTASERPAHFKGQQAHSLAEAVTLLSENNQKLAALVAKNQLTAEELLEVHQLTYTLENALQKIQTEMAGIATVLEEVHIASEKNDSATVKTRAQVYLETVADFTKSPE